jgi:hypothetical protein
VEAIRAGISNIWMVGGEPRHPSRWHQFVSDKYSRTTGGSFEERLDQVLESVPMSALRTKVGFHLPATTDERRETHRVNRNMLVFSPPTSSSTRNSTTLRDGTRTGWSPPGSLLVYWSAKGSGSQGNGRARACCVHTNGRDCRSRSR